MKILVKDPITNGKIEADGVHEEFNGEDAWKITSLGHGTFILLENGGEWKVAEGRNLVPELVKEIGISLHPLARYNSLKI